MKKLSFFIAIMSLLILASFAFASWKGVGLRLGISKSGQTTTVQGVEMNNGTAKVNGTLSNADAGTIYFNSTADKFYSCNSTGCSTFN